VKKSSAKSTAKTSTAKKGSTRTKSTTRAKTSSTRRAPAKRSTTATRATPRRGSVIQVDSEKVGSAPREGEVLEIIEGSVRVRYRVRWPDGHESLISPPAGSVRIVPSR
jgi:hypothetical protein